MSCECSGLRGARVVHHSAGSDEQERDDEKKGSDVLPAARDRAVVERCRGAGEGERPDAHGFSRRYCSRIRCDIPTAGLKQFSQSDFDELKTKMIIAISAVGSVLSAFGTNETNQLWKP